MQWSINEAPPMNTHVTPTIRMVMRMRGLPRSQRLMLSAT